MTVTKCWDCGSENREGARFCDGCGAKIELEAVQSGPQIASLPTEDEGAAPSMGEDEPALESTSDPDAGAPDLADEPALGTDSWDTDQAGSAEPSESEGEGVAEPTETEEEPPAPEPKAGYLIFPDSTEQPIPESQWLIGRADLEKFLSDPEKANEISRGHLTVFQEGDKFFVEDGRTMVQRKSSTNRTWLVRGSSRTLVTGTGRNELQDADEIDVAELVKLQFVKK